MKYDRVLKATFFAIAFVFLVYSAFWLVLSHFVNKELQKLAGSSASQGLYFENAIPPLRGYPFIPTLSYTGEIYFANVKMIVPEMTIKGYFIPGTGVTVDFPYGFAVDRTPYPALANADSFKARFVMPSDVPRSNRQQDIFAWQQKVGAITIRSFHARKGDLQLKGDGFIGLDRGLQPRVKLQTQIRGYEELVNALRKEGIVAEKDAKAALIVMKGISTLDPLTQERVLDIPFEIQANTIFLGPVPVARHGPIQWGRRMSPVPLQR